MRHLVVAINEVEHGIEDGFDFAVCDDFTTAVTCVGLRLGDMTGDAMLDVPINEIVMWMIMK